MKPLIILFTSFLCWTISYSQDSYEIRQIDSLTKISDTTTLQMLADSSNKKNSINGITMATKEYRFWYFDNQQSLKRVVWENNVSAYMSSDTSNNNSIIVLYYYNQNIIKMAHTEFSDSKVKKNECYFKDDKLIYSSAPLDNSKGDPAETMLKLSRMMLMQFNERKNTLPKTTTPQNLSSL